MNKVKSQELTNIKMVSGNENKYENVILDGVLKEWVGIGWISLRDATPDDFKKFPVVVE